MIGQQRVCSEVTRKALVPRVVAKICLLKGALGQGDNLSPRSFVTLYAMKPSKETYVPSYPNLFVVEFGSAEFDSCLRAQKVGTYIDINGVS